MDTMQLYRLCNDINETINHIINECSKLAQNEFKTRHDWVGNVNHGELRKKLKFDNIIKCYIHKRKSVKKNATQNSIEFWDTNNSLKFWDKNYLIPTRRPDEVII